MRPARFVIAALLLWAVSGCASKPSTASVVVVKNDADYDRLYAAALEVVGA